MGQPVTDPGAIEAIEADLMLTVYEAQRLARRRLLGQAPPPDPNPRALLLKRTGSLRSGAHRPSSPASSAS